MSSKNCLELLNQNTEKKPYLIVFVHGLGGGKDSFKNNEKKFFHEYFDDNILELCDICYFTYESKLFSSKFLTLMSETRWLNHKYNKNIEEITRTLFTNYKELSNEYQVINFIGHSMGGLIVKTMINKDEFVTNNDNKPFYITLGTPHAGSKLANYIPIIHEQKSYLKTNSPELIKTNIHFEYKRDKVNRFYYYGDHDVVVPKETAVPEYELKSFSELNICQEVTGNHTSICKPDSSSEYVILLKSINRQIKEFLPKKNSLNSTNLKNVLDYLKCYTENKEELDTLIHNFPHINSNYMLVSPKGIGKSCLLKELAKIHTHNVIYANLENGLKKDLEAIIESLNDNKKILILDGINITLINKSNDYKKDISHFFHEVEKKKDLKSKIIFSFDSENYSLEYINKSLSEFYYIVNIIEKMNNITFSRINKFKQNHLKEALEKYSPIKSENINKIMQIINESAFSKIDTFTLDLINKNIECKKFNFQELLLNKVRTILAERHESFSDVSHKIYDFYIKENKDSLNIMVNHHIYLQYALIAEYIINNSENENLEYIYPYEINSLCKDIIQTLDKTNRKKLLNKLMNYFDKNNYRAQTNYAYLLGRMEERECKVFLSKQYKYISKIIQNYNDKNRDEYKDILMLERTIIISLINSGDMSLSNEYIQILIKNFDSNNLNRGFHLEYYGDIPYSPIDFMEHEDSLSSCNRTFDLLYNKLQIGLNKKYNMFEVELFTILSIIQNRLTQDGKNDSSLIVKVDKLIELLEMIRKKVIHFNSIFLDYYTLLIKEYFIRYKNDKFIDYTYLLNNIYNFGDELRKGWVDRHVVNPESVPTHILKSYYLALMFLPDNLNNKSEYSDLDKAIYSKQQILDMLLIHDLGESIIGDFTPDEKEIKLIEEEKAIIKFSLYGTLLGFENTSSIYTNYHLFSNPSGNINSLIANDIDMIDSIIQSKFYHKNNRVKYDLFEEDDNKRTTNIHKVFYEYYIDRIKTNIGKEILLKLNLNYENS